MKIQFLDTTGRRRHRHSRLKGKGSVTIFAAIDHCTAECVGIHAVKKASRFEALEPVSQGVRERFGGFFHTPRRLVSQDGPDRTLTLHEYGLKKEAA